MRAAVRQSHPLTEAQLAKQLLIWSQLPALQCRAHVTPPEHVIALQEAGSGPMHSRQARVANCPKSFTFAHAFFPEHVTLHGKPVSLQPSVLLAQAFGPLQMMWHGRSYVQTSWFPN